MCIRDSLKDIVSIQPDAFRTPEYKYNNARIVCNSIPKLNLSAWYGELEFHDEEGSKDGIDASILNEMSDRRNAERVESDMVNKERRVENVQPSKKEYVGNEAEDERNYRLSQRKDSTETDVPAHAQSNDQDNVNEHQIEETIENLNDFKEPESMNCLLYTSPSPRDGLLSRMPSSA